LREIPPPRFPAFQGHLSSENPLFIHNSYSFFGFLFYTPRFVGLFSVSLILSGMQHLPKPPLSEADKAIMPVQVASLDQGETSVSRSQATVMLRQVRYRDLAMLALANLVKWGGP
jgi:hypothetical protein